MKNSAILFLFAFSLFLLFLLNFPKKVENEKNLTATEKAFRKKEYADFHYAYFQNKDFYGDLEKAESEAKISEQAAGGIVSHHFFVASKIAGFFAKIKNQNIKTIVILGPNHFDSGEGDILISKYPYNTPWGVVEPDEEIIDELLKEKIIKNEELPFVQEHSISSLVGFIKYFFPDAKIAPLILKKKTTPQEAELLAEKLNETLGEDVLVLASVDFSHHLNRTAAQFHDEASIAVMKNFTYDRIYNLEIDSPPAIYTLLKYLEKKEEQKMIYENTDSAAFSNDLEAEDVTSYLFAYFIKGEREREEKISLLSFGDAMFDRGVKMAMEKGINPLEKIKGAEGNFLKGVDFIAVNLEGPVTTAAICQKKAYSFKFSPETAELLSANKINLANLANNHSADCGEKGMNDTKKYLDDAAVDYFGGDKPSDSYFVKEVGGKKIAFASIDNTLKKININDFYQLINDLKKDNDYVAVNIHWGYEYNKLPSAEQRAIAYRLIDNGADVIIGHHPHITQPMEVYKNKAIFYSLGNFIFDQIGEETNKGFGVGVVLSDSAYSFYLFPYRIINYQPTLLPPEEAEKFCDNFLRQGGIKEKDACQFEIKSF